ncbi:LPS-assembly protein LptD [Sphingomonas sp.]|uniref:LPS-assembly protein LptD n=1 Tax=Sphingomonas sp. TaxID=28214 RepID=UPI003B3AD04F
MAGRTIWGQTGATRVSIMAVAAALASTAHAQDLTTRPVAPPAPTAAATNAPEDQVTFSAAQLDYDDNADIVTATGDVRMFRNGSRLRADKVTWNRQTGEMRAIGNVAVVNSDGDTAYGDDVKLTDDMKNGVAENMLLVLTNGGRLAARHGERKGERTVLDHAAYTPCTVEGKDGCPKRPSWQITAVRVIVDEGKHRIFYHDARFTLFGVTVLALPAFSHPDGSDTGRGGSGVLLPDVQLSKRNGFELDLPYYFQLAPNRDLTITPHIYTKVLPAIEGRYRALTSNGAYQISAMGTYGSRLPASATASTDDDKNEGPRGYLDANGTWQFGPYWTVHGAIRLASDRTFMKRYDISNDDRLRSTLKAERIDSDSYLSIAGWFVQDLRPGFSQGQQPIALPQIDYRRRFTDPLLGGVFTAQLNSLALTRTGGQDTQRAFAGLRWDLRTLTSLGQEVTFTAYGRTDVYHTDDSAATATPLYRGTDGWHGRAIGALAADMRWPFVGTLFGGTQQIVPRIQVVAEPHVKNLSIPDEDSRAVDLEDSNLFALNRLSGYDRWEDTSRITYGGEWNYNRPKFDMRAIIGQSYRLSNEPALLPPGTGLSDRFSDYVGRVSIRYGSFLELTERFRLDKHNLQVRRNEVDATIGGSTTYVQVGYLKLNRNIDRSIEDLRDRSEIRLAARLKLARYWSLFGSTVVDLTNKRDDPTANADGYEPVRHRLGLLYENECMSLGVTWRKDYDPTGDARRGSTFSLRLALKNIGR